MIKQEILKFFKKLLVGLGVLIILVLFCLVLGYIFLAPILVVAKGAPLSIMGVVILTPLMGKIIACAVVVVSVGWICYVTGNEIVR